MSPSFPNKNRFGLQVRHGVGSVASADRSRPACGAGSPAAPSWAATQRAAIVCFRVQNDRRSCAEGFAMVNHTHSPAFVIVSAKNIALRAHEIYVDRGYADGFDREDWLQAERELKDPPSAERVFPRDAKRR